jgi:hypothetical protein
MSFTRPSVQTELDRFFKLISKSPNSFESITKSAFTQSRKKLNPEAFIELSKSQLEYFNKNAPYKKTWNGKRVIGIDGSLLNLPTSDELRNEFGYVKNQHEEIISARCSFAYDVCNELILDSKIDRRRSCEKELAVEHLSSLNSDSDILVFDRGYPCQWLMGLLMKKGFKFCFRLSTAWKDAVTLMNSDENDIDWFLSRRSKRDLGKIKQYNIPIQLEGLRLVCIELSSGEKEILATNLTDRDEFDLKKMKELYHLRWGIEEAFKSFKKVLHVEHFTGRTVTAVKQDFYAKVFMLNLASMIRTQGLKEGEKKNKGTTRYKQQPNKTQVLAKTKDFLIDLFYFKNIKQIINQMLKILDKRFEIVRPNRSYPRIETSSRRRYKGLNSRGI